MKTTTRWLAGDAISKGLLAVYTLLFAAFLLAPIVIVVAASFNPEASVMVPYEGFSLRWYQRLLEYRPFTSAMATSIGLAFVATAIAVVIAVPAALGLARSRSRAASVAISLLLSPIAIPPLVIGLSMLYYLSALGIGVSLFALVVTHTVVSVPYVMRTVLAACRNLGSSFDEAARVLGATGWQAFRFVTLPLIVPGVFAGALFAILMSLDNLGLSYFFGTAKVTTLPVVMLSYLQNQFDPLIAAVSTVQMALAIALLLFVERVYGLRALTTQ
jgi:putative spermidine/putrescine transport system permease protein